MTSKATAAKAARLVVEGRVAHLADVVTDSGEPIRFFTVKGDTASYRVAWHDWGMRCTCPSRRACSHERAVVLWSTRFERYLPPANIINGQA